MWEVDRIRPPTAGCLTAAHGSVDGAVICACMYSNSKRRRVDVDGWRSCQGNAEVISDMSQSDTVSHFCWMVTLSGFSWAFPIVAAHRWGSLCCFDTVRSVVQWVSIQVGPPLRGTLSKALNRSAAADVWNVSSVALKIGCCRWFNHSAVKCLVLWWAQS